MELTKETDKELEEVAEKIKAGVRTLETKIGKTLVEASKCCTQLEHTISAGIMDALAVLAQMINDMGAKRAASIATTFTIMNMTKKVSFETAKLTDGLQTAKLTDVKDHEKAQALLKNASAKLSKDGQALFAEFLSEAEKADKDFEAELGKEARKLYAYLVNSLKHIATAAAKALCNILVVGMAIANSITVSEQYTLAIDGQTILTMKMEITVDTKQWQDDLEALAGDSSGKSGAATKTGSQQAANEQPTSSQQAANEQPTSSQQAAQQADEDTAAKAGTNTG